jgi:hypothetical protein
MSNSIFYKYIATVLTVSALFFLCNSNTSAQRSKLVTVKFEVGIYRDWDKSWMMTDPKDVVATITTSKGTFTKSPTSYKGIVTFTNVPCGESIKINIRFVGTASYKSNSRNYTKNISCAKPIVNLGKLEYGTW